MNVSVFGGSQPQAGSAAYQEAYHLGRLLARAGHVVVTGGYIGTMEAVSRGAAEAGGHVIGVTCAQIERWRPVKPNAWVREERRCETLLERLQALIEGCNAAIALPGGPGTLAEIALTWNLMIIGAISPRPLIVVGEGWRAVIEKMHAKLGEYIPEEQRALVQLAGTVDRAVEMVDRR